MNNNAEPFKKLPPGNLPNQREKRLGKSFFKPKKKKRSGYNPVMTALPEANVKEKSKQIDTNVKFYFSTFTILLKRKNAIKSIFIRPAIKLNIKSEALFLIYCQHRLYCQFIENQRYLSRNSSECRIKLHAHDSSIRR